MKAKEFIIENDDDDHGYLPIPLKLGDYRDSYNPRDYGPYDDRFKDNQDLRDIVENLIDAGVEPAVVMISPRQLIATQDWLADARYRDSDPLFGDYEDRPVVLKYRGVDYILDGHHRCSSALRANQKLNVYLFTAPQGIKEAVSEDIGHNLPVLYHGGNHQIDKFDIPPSGVFFSPHKDWAENYGDVVTRVRVPAAKVYVVSSQAASEDPKGFAARLLDALFGREYNRLAKFIQILQAKGYSALQTQTDSEMVCVFPGTKIDILVDENFADGKGPGQPGDSVRHGIPKNATMAELERASHSKGRKGQLARWQLNMRRGHKK